MSNSSQEAIYCSFIPDGWLNGIFILIVFPTTLIQPFKIWEQFQHLMGMLSVLLLCLSTGLLIKHFLVSFFNFWCLPFEDKAGRKEAIALCALSTSIPTDRRKHCCSWFFSLSWRLCQQTDQQDQANFRSHKKEEEVTRENSSSGRKFWRKKKHLAGFGCTLY